MMLVELKRYLAETKVTNLQQLCEHFQTEPELMRLQLQHWINKGKVRKAAKLPGCGSRCNKCLPQLVEIYEWIN